MVCGAITDPSARAIHPGWLIVGRASCDESILGRVSQLVLRFFPRLFEEAKSRALSDLFGGLLFARRRERSIFVSLLRVTGLFARHISRIVVILTFRIFAGLLLIRASVVVCHLSSRFLGKSNKVEQDQRPHVPRDHFLPPARWAD